MGRLTKTRRVSRHEPCPICNRPTWCLVARDGTYAVCNRVESDRPAKGAGGGWVHRLREATARVPTQPYRHDAPTSSARIARIERRHRVYQHLLAHMPLGSVHRQGLLARGFSPAEIELRNYGSLPVQGRARVAQDIMQAQPLDGVPGFWPAANERGSYWTLAGSPGLLIPVRAPDKRLRAMRIRPDDARGEGKYRWLSSADKPGGTAAEACCHVARPLCERVRDERVWIVEGEIKADLSAERLGAIVLSIPGVSLWSRALPDLAELLPQRGRVVVALDADWRENRHVHDAIRGLLLACEALGYDVGVALWDVSCKGLDELLVAGRQPEIRLPTDIPAPPWELKWSSRIRCEIPMPVALSTALPLPEIRRRLVAAFAGDDRCRSSA